MSDWAETAAIVALLRREPSAWAKIAAEVEESASALALLEQRHGLLASLELSETAAEVDRWSQAGMRPLTLLDPDYPANLRAVHDRPPLVFVAGRLLQSDQRAVAVIGSRAASGQALGAARSLAQALAAAGLTVVSGLAAGIDTAAHSAALEACGRTIAVVGTGLGRCYPPQNRVLQAVIASRGAVISRFWPGDPPSRSSFALRNALMSGLSLANVIVEAAERSGCRTQARAALAHGRPVFIHRRVLEQRWARELAARPGVRVYGEPAEVIAAVERLSVATLAG
jgi:DNA processing protein